MPGGTSANKLPDPGLPDLDLFRLGDRSLIGRAFFLRSLTVPISGGIVKPALLIIDMQNDFVRDGAPLKVGDASLVIGTIRSVLEAFRAHRLPVFHILRVHRKDGSDVEIFRRDLFQRMPFAVEGTEGAEVISELRPREGEYTVRKTRMSAFLHTDLDLVLRTIGIDTLFVTGIQTPNCVRATVFDASALNYRVVLVEDAVAARDREVHRANCADMEAIGVGMISSGLVPPAIGAGMPERPGS